MLSENLNQKEFASGVFDQQRVRVGQIGVEFESCRIEKTEVYLVASSFADC